MHDLFLQFIKNTRQIDLTKLISRRTNLLAKKPLYPFIFLCEEVVLLHSLGLLTQRSIEAFYHNVCVYICINCMSFTVHTTKLMCCFFRILSI